MLVDHPFTYPGQQTCNVCACCAQMLCLLSGVEADPEVLAAQQRLAEEEVAAWRQQEVR